MEEYLEIEGLKIRYKKSGEGNPIVLLHGWGCDLNIFEKVHENLANNFQVYSIDFPGFGKSNTPNKVWGVKEYTKCIEVFFKKKGITNPILIGHSFGGRVSILYSAYNSVNKLILIDSAGIKPKRRLLYYFKVYSYKLVKKILLLVYGNEKGEIILEKYRKKVGSSDYQNSNGIMRNILIKIINEDLKNVMPNIKAPTLLIWGKKDTATPLSDAKIIEKLIPNSGLVVFDNAGHYSFLERLTEFLIIINNFLGQQNN